MKIEQKILLISNYECQIDQLEHYFPTRLKKYLNEGWIIKSITPWQQNEGREQQLVFLLERNNI